MIRERQRGAYRRRKQALNAVEQTEARERVVTEEQKAAVARSYGISHETLYQYLRMAEDEK